MKLRLKLENSSKTLDLGSDVGPNHLCLEDLRTKVKEEFELKIPFNLSLNKKDVLEGSDETLDKFGIVFGDVLYVIIEGQDSISPKVPQATNRDVSNAHHEIERSKSSSGDLVKPAERNSTVEQEQESTVSNIHEDPMEGPSGLQPNENDPVVNRCLQEPLQCCESTSEAVPHILSQLYDSVVPQNGHDMVWVAVHVLMLESGFISLQETSDDSVTSMPSNWKQPSLYNIKYQLPESDEVVCSLTGVTLGTSMCIQGSLKAGDEEDNSVANTSVKSQEFVTEDFKSGVTRCYRNLKQLSRTIKDQICLPLLCALRTALGYPSGLHLLSLTHEIKLKILGYLNCPGVLRMSQTCQHFRSLCRERVVWRRRYLLDFGSRCDNSLSQNWYEMYKVQYKLRKDHMKALRERMFLVPGQSWTHPHPHPPWAPVNPYSGGILGGDYDLNPQFHGIPNPLGRSRNPLQPFFPGPRFDPYGPLPEHNIFPGRGRGRGRGGGWMGGFGGGPRMF